MQKIIIGLVGPKTCGKTTVGDYIGKLLPIKRMALADKLKDACAYAFDISRITFDSQALKEVPFKEMGIYPNPKLGINELKTITQAFDLNISDFYLYNIVAKDYTLNTARDIAQVVGTEVLRELGGNNIHCKALYNTIMSGNSQYYIVEDNRFSNEFDFFNNIEGARFVPIYINRNIAEAAVTEKSHQSERDFLKFRDKCFKLDNNSSIDDLYKRISSYLTDISLL